MKVRERLQNLLRDVEDNDPLAQTVLGYLFEHGIHLTKNAEKALSNYKNAATSDFPPAQYRLALSLNESDPSASLYWLKKSADAKFPPAEYLLSVFYWEKYYDAEIIGVCIKLLESAAQKNYTPALLRLSGIYAVNSIYNAQERGVQPNESKRKEYARLAAYAGSKLGAELYTMLVMQSGTPSERDDALDWLKRESEKGNKVASGVLANIYGMGLYNVEKNAKLASLYTKRAR